MRRSLIVGICLLSACATVCAQQNAPRTYSADGKTINYNLTVFNPPVPIQPDPARLNQESAINCTLVFVSRMQQADVEGAAAVTTDPGAVIKTYAAYRARSGDAAFLKNVSQLFHGDRYVYQLNIGSEYALISEQEGGAAQILVEKQGKFWMDRSDLAHQSPEYKNLFALVNAQAAGKLQFK